MFRQKNIIPLEDAVKRFEESARRNNMLSYTQGLILFMHICGIFGLETSGRTTEFLIR